jgi:hypothetical protein
MSYDLDMSDITGEEQLTGFEPCKPGRYHAVVTEVDDTFTKSDRSIVAEFEILTGTVNGQNGKKIKEFLATSDKAKKRLAGFAMAVGLISPTDLGSRKSINWQDAAGRQLVIDVEEQEYEKDGQKRMGARIEFLGFHAISSPKAADVPKDKNALAVAGLTAAAGNAAAADSSAAAPPQQQAAPVGNAGGAAPAADPYASMGL